MMYGRGYNGFSNCFGFGFGFGTGHTFGGWGMMIIMAAFILLTTAVVIYITKRTGHHRSEDEALQSLKMRFAKGEISEEEYLKRKNILD